MARSRVGMDLTEGSVFKKMCIYALPLLLANFLQQAYNSVDTIIIGQFVGSIGTVGVSTGGDIAALVTYIAMGFSSAGQIYVAQLVGAKDTEKISKTIGTLFTLMIITSTVCMLGSIFFCKPLLQLMNCPEEAMTEASNYMIIVSLGLPAVFIYNAICGVLRGMGESKRPLIFIAISAAANVVLDLLLVAVFPLAAAGTAIATIGAQYASCITALIYMFKNKESFSFGFKLNEFKVYSEQAINLTKLGIPMTAKLALIYASQIFCSAQINTFGLVASATNSIGNKINKLVNVFVSSLDTAAASMIGQSLGAKKQDRAKQAVYAALIFALIFNGILSLAAFFFPTQIYSLYTSDPEVIEFGRTFMQVAIVMFMLSAVQGPYTAMITGSGHASLAFISGILDSVVLRIGISLFMAYTLNMGVVGFFWGNALARIAPCIIALVYFYSGKWKTRKLLSEGGRGRH